MMKEDDGQSELGEMRENWPTLDIEAVDKLWNILEEEKGNYLPYLTDSK